MNARPSPSPGIDDFSAALDVLAGGLMRGPGLRVWSLVVTVLGDSISPRGGVVRLGALQPILGRVGIDPGAVRTAASRLARDGWLERERRGRAAFYRLVSGQRGAFERATRRIYAAAPPRWSGNWLVAVAPEERAARRDDRAARLEKAGFGRLGPGAFIHPHAETLEGEGDMTLLRVPHDATRFPAGALAAAWPGAAAAAALHRDLLARFAPLDAALGAPAPLDALAARTLLIHCWRRAILRDPELPPAAAPPDWPGEEARALVARLYRRLAGPAEAWLDACDGGPDGRLPPPDAAFFRRFGGL